MSDSLTQTATPDTTSSSTATVINAITVDEPASAQSFYKTIGQQLGYYEVVLTNITTEEAILSALAKFNYTPEKISKGKELLELAQQADAKNAQEYGEQYAATQKVEAEYQAVAKPYMTSLAVARIAFKNDPEALNALVLKGKRAVSLANWLRNADVFYRNILDNSVFLSRMAEYGRTAEILKAEYDAIDKVRAAYAIQRKEIGDAIESTTVRDTRMNELESWMSDLISITRIALQDNPDWLTKLGL